MTRYDKYQKKLLKLRKVRDFFYRFRVLFISILSAIIITSASLIGITGVVTSISASDNAFTYGEDYSFTGEAIFSDVIYEYKELDSDTWSEQKPYKVGTYNYRYYSYGTFNVKYSDVKTFSIVPKRLDVKILEDAIIYGKKPHIEHEDLMFDDKITQYDSIFQTLVELRSDVYVKKDSVVIQDNQGNDVTYCYDIICPIKNLIIVPRDITIKTFGGTKEYDGTPLNNDLFEIIKGDLAYEDQLIVGGSNYIEEPGYIVNKRDFKIINKDNKDVTHLYNIETNYGLLTINKRKIEIKTSTHEKIYDGKPFDLQYEITSGSILKNHRIVPHFKNEDVIDVCDFTNNLEIDIFDNEGHDVKKYYDITYDYGHLKINKRPLIIKTATDSKIYDDVMLFNDSYEFVENTSLAENEKLNIVKYDSITNAGSIVNSFETFVDRFGKDVSSNYDIKYQNGTLTVNKRPIEINIIKQSKVYDGFPLYGDEFETTNVIPTHQVNLYTYNSITKVGKADADPFVFAIQDKENGEDKTSNYDVTINNQTDALEITKRPLKLATIGDQKIYDGKPLFRHEYEYLEGTSLAYGDTLNATFNQSITDAGTVSNTMDIEIYNNNLEDVTDCYDIDIICRDLIVDKMLITVKTYDDEKIYDGEPYFIRNNVYTEQQLPDGHTITGDVISDGVDVGTYDINIVPDSIVIKNSQGEVKNDNFIIAYASTPAKLEIKPREIHIKPKDECKVYDDLPLTPKEFDIFYGNLVKDHILNATLSGSVTYPEDSPRNSFIDSYDIYCPNESRYVTFNYDVICFQGLLTVMPRPITIKSTDVSKVYDGSPITFEEYAIYNVTEGSLLPNHKMKISFEKSDVLNVIDTRKNYFNVNIYDQNNIDVTFRYMINSVYGDINIYPRPISLGMDSYSCTYNGVPVLHGSKEFVNVTSSTAPLYIKNGTLIPNSKLYALAYAETDIPAKINIPFLDWKIIKEDGTIDLASNYSMTFNQVYLNVNKIHLTIETRSGRKIYDGLPFENYSWIASGFVLPDHEMVYEIDQNIIEVGSYENKVMNFHIYDKHGNDVKDIYYQYQFFAGRIRIEQDYY